MKVVKDNILHYIKYKYAEWTQPTLTVNGTLGKSSFACNGSASVTNSYYCFDGTTSSWDTYSNAAPQWITWYNPNALNITALSIFQYVEPNYYYITSAVIQGSNDNSTWTDLKTLGSYYNVTEIVVDMSDNTEYYKYYRLYVNSTAYYSGYPRVMIGEIKITATEKIPIESSITDYDEIITETKYKLIKENNKYYGFKSI